METTGAELSPQRPPATPVEAQRARVAVALFFFTNGALYASIAARIPDLKEKLDLSNAALGSAVSGLGLGALLVGFAGGALVTKWGSASVATYLTMAAAANLVFVAASPSWLVLVIAFFIAGALDSLVDVAENAHALRVEAIYRRSILNSLHGVWSIGAVTGGAAGAAAAGLDVPLNVHLPLAGAAFSIIAIGASRLLLSGHDRAERPVPSEVVAGRPAGAPRRLSLGVAVLALGLFATLAQSIEEGGATWSGIYLRNDLGAAPALGGMAFVALQGMQTLGRLSGDRSVTRFGDLAVARFGAAAAALALVFALAVPSAGATIAAFGIAGFGIATLIPTAMRNADGLTGLSPGVGLTLVGSVSRVGSLLIPPLIGLLADTYTLRTGLILMPVAALILLLLAGPISGHSKGHEN